MLLRIYLESYGCTLNHGEARYLKDLLISSGHVFLENPEQADIVVLFSCCVIETTELKMLRRAKRFSELGKPLIVSGCMAVVRRSALESAHDNVHFLYFFYKIITKLNSFINTNTSNILAV